MVVFCFFEKLVEKVEQNGELGEVEGYEWQVPGWVEFESKV